MGLQLGQEQLAESRRQYDINRAAAAPVTQAQLDLMREVTRQGKDYYDYGLRGRPVEDELNRQSMIDTSGRDQAERDLITGGDTGIYNARRADIEDQVGRATADARQGLSSQYNQLLRQAMRYGYSPQAVAARIGPAAVQSGLGIASIANQARQGGIANARNLLAQNRGFRIQDEAIPWARKLDVAGLYRGMPGASQGAYGLGIGSGTAAVQNTMAPGSQLLGGMAQGAGMQQTGQAQRLSGLGNVLNAQTGAYTTGINADASAGGGALGGLVGLAGTLGSAYLLSGSDRRLKRDIELVGVDDRTGLHLYEFRYIEGTKRYRGVMADEVAQVMPEAVEYDKYGYASVNYSMLGLTMMEV
jgi:hypothetical protein